MTGEVAPDVTSMLYYQVADLKEWTFAHIVRRPIRTDEVEGTTRHIDSHRHTLLETYAFKDATEERRERIVSDYQELLRSYEEKESHPLGFGDFTAFVQSTLDETKDGEGE